MDKSDTKPAETKSDTAMSSDAADTAASPKPEAGGAKPKKDPPRPASYFSSVRSDEYRAGWDSVFGKANSKPHRRKGPATLELSAEDLTAEERATLLVAAKRKAGSRRASLARAAKNGELDLSIVYRIGRENPG